MTTTPQCGQIWRQLDFPCFDVVVQWVKGDKFGLLSSPQKATHGGTCMIFHTDEDGTWLWTREELAARMDRLHYSLAEGARLEVVTLPAEYPSPTGAGLV